MTLGVTIEGARAKACVARRQSVQRESWSFAKLQLGVPLLMVICGSGSAAARGGARADSVIERIKNCIGRDHARPNQIILLRDISK
jgi:hypothetical protein